MAELQKSEPRCLLIKNRPQVTESHSELGREQGDRLWSEEL